MRLHHVGLVVADYEAVARHYREILGLAEFRTGTDDKLQVRWRWLVAGSDTYIELLTPIGDGPIRRHLDEHGDGLHHLSFEPSDFHSCLRRLADAAEPLFGIDLDHDGWQEMFLDVDRMGGALVQIAREVKRGRPPEQILP